VSKEGAPVPSNAKAFNGNCLLSLQQAETTSITVKEIKEIKHELYGNVYTALRDSTIKPMS